VSVTGHNDVRRAGDFYPTPAWCTEAILHHLPSGDVLDPGAGTGAILSVVAAQDPQRKRLGYELSESHARLARDAGHAVILRDALSDVPWTPARVVLMNPPFNLAQEFVDRALLEAPVVCALLRLNWLAGLKRASFHRANPSDVYVLPRRPSFTGKGTDACDYAWFVWSPGGGGRWSILELPATQAPEPS
jgi:predicted RNA methylase